MLTRARGAFRGATLRIVPSEAAATCTTALTPLGLRAHPRPIRFEGSGVEIRRFYKADPGGLDVLSLDCFLTTHPTIAAAWHGRV